RVGNVSSGAADDATSELVGHAASAVGKSRELVGETLRSAVRTAGAVEAAVPRDISRALARVTRMAEQTITDVRLRLIGQQAPPHRQA
ncbi:MAG: hypothetical protein AAB426_03050, partial [Myxococcota bacterium]